MHKYKIALAGNPNVGKSTVFNALTGLHQHTGNWPGKTVENAVGSFFYHDNEYTIYDLPGTYSLLSHSEEEEIARNFLCFEKPELVIVVCDATSLERNLSFVLQVKEIHSNVLVCVNLLDEAKKKKIEVDLLKLSELLNTPVVGISARKKEGFDELLNTIESLCLTPNEEYFKLSYGKEIEYAVSIIENEWNQYYDKYKRSHYFCLQLLDDTELKHTIYEKYPIPNIEKAVQKAKGYLFLKKIDWKEIIAEQFIKNSEMISKEVITYKKGNIFEKEKRLDQILTSKKYGFPIMILLLIFIFWITIEFANIPSNLLFSFFQILGEYLSKSLSFLPRWLHELLFSGIYKTLTWVVSVMLPPMAIFFPLFTLLEDFGYLPRIAFNLDYYFQKCKACGKQALTMCMGFGCNAVGVTGARIIDSKRERLMAIITNVFVPCNGRFPTIVALITMFFVGFSNDFFSSIYSTFLLCIVILLGVFLTFFLSFILSKTVLKGIPSSFTLELPHYRSPQYKKVFIRSILDRTLFVLGRAVVVAIPAGLIIWLLANIKIDNMSLLIHVSNFIDPFGKLIGLDGIILLSFLLGFPANEIVFPIMIMAYMQTGSIAEFSDLSMLKELLIKNGWTSITAVCTILFCLVHFPCSTTLLIIKKETGSFKWTMLSFLIPTLCGVLLCFITSSFLRLFS